MDIFNPKHVINPYPFMYFNFALMGKIPDLSITKLIYVTTDFSIDQVGDHQALKKLMRSSICQKLETSMGGLQQ